MNFWAATVGIFFSLANAWHTLNIDSHQTEQQSSSIEHSGHFRNMHYFIFHLKRANISLSHDHTLVCFAFSEDKKWISTFGRNLWCSLECSWIFIYELNAIYLWAYGFCLFIKAILPFEHKVNVGHQFSEIKFCTEKLLKGAKSHVCLIFKKLTI